MMAQMHGASWRPNQAIWALSIDLRRFSHTIAIRFGIAIALCASGSIVARACIPAIIDSMLSSLKRVRHLCESTLPQICVLDTCSHR